MDKLKHLCERVQTVYRRNFASLIICLAVSVVAGGFSMVAAPNSPSSFEGALVSRGPSPQIPKAAASTWDWVVGDWEAEVTDMEPDGAKWTGAGEWHFRWVLEGRAIQDVWIVPKLSQRTASTDAEHNRFGSTLRIYDPALDAWRIFWFNPVRQVRSELVARKVANDIVLQGVDDDGSLMRWTFADIKPDSFVWRGESSRDGGKTWQLGAQFICRRTKED